MTTDASITKKSTNVRKLRWTRAGLSLLAKLAPAAAERQALAIYSRPMRPAPPRPPVAPALSARRFVVPVGPDQVVAWEWGAGPTVLVAHGWSGYAGQMAAFVAPLVGAGHRVVAFDQPAHGESSGRQSSLPGLRDAAVAVAAHVGGADAVVAHSLGATATLLAIAEGRLPAPQRFVALAPPTDPFPYARAFAAGLGLSPVRGEGLVVLLRRFLSDSPLALDIDALGARLSLPGLVIHDREDDMVPLHDAEALVRAWPHARLLPVSGLGHRRLLRDPAVIADAITFLVEKAPWTTSSGE